MRRRTFLALAGGAACEVGHAADGPGLVCRHLGEPEAEAGASAGGSWLFSPAALTPAAALRLARIHGRPLVAVCHANRHSLRMGHVEPGIRTVALAELHFTVRWAAAAGCPLVVTARGVGPMGRGEQIDAAVAGLRAALAEAASLGVKLALEPDPHEDAAAAGRFVAAMDHPALGLCAPAGEAAESMASWSAGRRLPGDDAAMLTVSPGVFSAAARRPL